MGRTDSDNAELHNAELRAPSCRTCGCTDSDCSGCIAKTGAPCFWIERDLCSACGVVPPEQLPVESLARSLCVRHGSPAAMVLMLDGVGALHIGCAAIDHPIARPFVAMAQSIDVAVARGVPGFDGFSRERAIEIARRCAKAKPQSYYAEPFEPHEWVVDAILQAAAELPPARTTCSHCGEGVCAPDDVVGIRAHMMTCEASPVVQKCKRLQRVVDQAEVVARHWETQDGINGAELDKLRDIVFDRPEPVS